MQATRWTVLKGRSMTARLLACSVGVPPAIPHSTRRCSAGRCASEAAGGGGQASVQIGDIGGAIIRGNAAARAAAAAAAAGTAAVAPPPAPAGKVTAAIGHISFGIENWNTERVREELKKRDVVYVNRDGQREPRPDMTGTLESFHVPDAMGWDLQIGNKIGPSTWG